MKLRFLAPSSGITEAERDQNVDTGTGGHRGCGRRGHVPRVNFAISKLVPFLFLENASFFLRKNTLEVSCPQVLDASYVTTSLDQNVSAVSG